SAVSSSMVWPDNLPADRSNRLIRASGLKPRRGTVPHAAGRVADVAAELLGVVPGADPGGAEIGGDPQHSVLVPLLAEVRDVVVNVVADTVGDHTADRDTRGHAEHGSTGDGQAGHCPADHARHRGSRG